MRWFVTVEWTRNRLLQTIVVCYAVYVMLLWCTNAMLYFAKMSLTPSSVVDYYLGNEALFTSPRSYKALLEVSHFHRFSIGGLRLEDHLPPSAITDRLVLSGQVAEGHLHRRAFRRPAPDADRLVTLQHHITTEDTVYLERLGSGQRLRANSDQ